MLMGGDNICFHCQYYCKDPIFQSVSVEDTMNNPITQYSTTWGKGDKEEIWCLSSQHATV